MTDAAENVPAPSAAAQRMRRYRRRRRHGVHYVRVPLHVTEVDVLVEMRFLKEEDRHDPQGLQAAVRGLAGGPEPLRNARPPARAPIAIGGR
jgi:hypothetical protein